MSLALMCDIFLTALINRPGHIEQFLLKIICLKPLASINKILSGLLFNFFKRFSLSNKIFSSLILNKHCMAELIKHVFPKF